MGLDRPLLARTPGLRFWRLLGTGAGDRMTLSADLRRWALLAIWDSPADGQRFIDDHEISRRWSALGSERYDLTMAPLRARGRWGRAHFAIRGGAAEPGEPIAVLTRAAVRPTRLLPFWRSAGPVGTAVTAHPALLASVGIGDVPVLRQATFSVWDSLDGVRDYAYRQAAHRDVVARTREEDWYSSELFARFRPLGSRGTWNGRDPLAGRL